MAAHTWFLLTVLILGALSFQCAIDQAFDGWIERQFSFFRHGITNGLVQKAKQYPNTGSVSFSNGKVQSSMSRFPKRVQLFMNDIAPNIPDLEFVINNYDEARVLKRPCQPNEDWKKCSCDSNFTDFSHGMFIKPCTWAPIYEQVPIFSPASVPQCFLDIIMPSPHHIADHYYRTNIPWDEKQFKAIWRGGTTGGNFGGNWCSRTNFQQRAINFDEFHRHKLVRLCQKISDCDAKFSVYVLCSPDICEKMRKSYGEPECALMENQSVNKLIIDIDGNSYSRRFPTLMATGSVVLKMATYVDVGCMPAKPWVHYIPVKMDLSDLQQKIQWAKNNDKQLEQIGKRGRQLTLRTLKVKHYKCYMTKLLLKYHSLLVSEETYQTNRKNDPTL